MSLQSSSSVQTKKSCFLLFSKKSRKRDLAQAMKELKEKQNIVQTLTIEKEELEKQLVDALQGRALAETKAADAEVTLQSDTLQELTKTSQALSLLQNEISELLKLLVTQENENDVQIETVGLHQLKEEIERLKEEAKANKDHMLQYKNIAQVNGLALKKVESAHERFKAEADRIQKSHEAEVLSLRERISELEGGFSVKFKEAATVVAGKEAALSSALAELDILKAENSVNISRIAGLESQISSLKADLEEHQRWRDAENNHERQRDLAQAMKELQEKQNIVQTLTVEKEELEEQLVDAWRGRALDETKAADAEGVVGGDGPSTSMTTVIRASWDVSSAVPRCQVVGCPADLTMEKNYCRQRKICDKHAKACVVSIEHRYCQKCNRFHLLSEFDGVKRSCRRALDMHNKRRRKS